MNLDGQTRIVNIGKNNEENILADTYQANSIENAERAERGKGSSVIIASAICIQFR